MFDENTHGRELLDQDSEVEMEGGTETSGDVLKHPRMQQNIQEFPFSPPDHTVPVQSFGIGKKKKKSVASLIEPVYEFLSTTTNFEGMPPSSKVLVFDVDMKVNDALKIACENDVSYSSLWDRKAQKLIGMLTVSDLVNIIIYCKNRKELLANLLNTKSIREWRVMAKESQKDNKELGKENLKRQMPDSFVFVSPEDTLWNSICQIIKHGIHRIPVLSKDESLLHVHTNVSILVHLVRYCNFQNDIFNSTLEELNLGVYEGVYTCTKNQKVFDVLETFARNGISCVPITNESGIVEDIFIKKDVVFLLRQGRIQLDCTIEEALNLRPKCPMFTCRKSELLGRILRHLVGTRIHKLVCVDEKFRVVGIISISDIFEFFLKHYPAFLQKGL